MNMQELTIKRREGTGKSVVRKLRRAGAVPAILYGGTSPQAITVDPRAVLRIIHGHEGSTQLLSLKFDGDGDRASLMAIIRDMQFDPVSDALLHVDLQEVSADRAITVRVAVHPVGEAIGVKEITWVSAAGAEMREEDWTNGGRCFGMLLDGRAQVTGIKQRGQDATLLLIVNSHHEAVPFTLPPAGDDLAGAPWTLLLDTQFDAPAHTTENEHAAGEVYDVAARSLLLLKLKLPPDAPLWSEQR